MKRLFQILCLSFLLGPKLTLSAPESARNIIHLLSYIASDYSGAVQNGKVVSTSEYEEQVEFSKSVVDMAKVDSEMNLHPEILKSLEALRGLIIHKSSAEKVRETVEQSQNLIFKISSVQRAPRKWPNITHGKEIYSKNCTQCHGVSGQGDGPSAGNFDPKPTNFLDSKSDFISPFQFFNAIHLGVPGTAMSAFQSISETETWDLAFYLSSLRHKNKNVEAALTHPWTLEQVASLSDNELRKTLTSTENVESALTLARTFNVSEGSENSLVSLTRENLLASFDAFKTKNFELAKSKAIAAYLDGIEPLEPKLRLNDSEFTLGLEESLALYRRQIDERVSVSELEKSLSKALDLLDQSSKVLQSKPTSFGVTFVVAAGIFLREALEAALLLITLLGVVRSLGNVKAVYSIHCGWVSAALVGVVSWFFSGWLVKFSGLGREVLEGSISLLAVLVLLYFGFWLHRKTEIGKWRGFINQLVKSAIDNKKLAGLAVVAFMGVFREAFETVLFLRALLLESPGQELALGLGVLGSFGGVLLVSSYAVKYSAKLPLKQLFSLSSVMMLLLAFILMGKSVHAFQEAGILSATVVSGLGRIEWLGIFPTLENLLPQMVLLTVAFMIWIKPRLQKNGSSFSANS